MQKDCPFESLSFTKYVSYCIQINFSVVMTICRKHSFLLVLLLFENLFFFNILKMAYFHDSRSIMQFKKIFIHIALKKSCDKFCFVNKLLVLSSVKTCFATLQQLMMKS